MQGIIDLCNASPPSRNRLQTDNKNHCLIEFQHIQYALEHVPQLILNAEFFVSFIKRLICRNSTRKPTGCINMSGIICWREIRIPKKSNRDFLPVLLMVIITLISFHHSQMQICGFICCVLWVNVVNQKLIQMIIRFLTSELPRLS